METKEKDGKEEKTLLQYGVGERPPIHLLLVLALQQSISTIGAPVTIVYIIARSVCAAKNYQLMAELISTNVIMGGICTLLQTFIGVRLPLIQGSSFSFIPPIIAMMTTDRWRCPSMMERNGTFLTGGTNSSQVVNVTSLDDLWRPRVNEINGALLIAAAVQVAVGMSGAIGYLLPYIGPLTIVPTIALVSLSIYGGTVSACQHNWGIALLTVMLVIICSLVLNNVRVPLPTWSRGRGCSVNRYRVFRMLPNILALLLAWLVCYILTVTGALTSEPGTVGYMTRTDAKSEVFQKTKWFFFPLPGQWGRPTLSGGVFLGMFAATISSIVESIGDYYACARACEVPNPPKHAVNRGIAMEGLGNLLGAGLGATCGTNTYSTPVGLIAITGVASRSVWMVMSVMTILFGLFGKFGAAMTTIPDPVIGGLTLAGLGVLLSVALSNLQFIDLTRPRAAMILGISIMMGVMIPSWLKVNPHAIKTGSEEADQMFTVILSTGMCVGGTTAFILDNIIPGTREERGMHLFLQDGRTFRDVDNSVTNPESTKEYDLPYVTKWLNKYRACAIIPCLPRYEPVPPVADQGRSQD